MFKEKLAEIGNYNKIVSVTLIVLNKDNLVLQCSSMSKIYRWNGKQYTELQIRGSTEDNSKIIFLISQQKHML